MPSTLEPPHSPASETRLARGCILYVDDDPSHIALLREAFAGDDIDLITAPTGESGIELARARLPDLIILAIELSPMSGAEAVTLLRESEPTGNIPIVAFSTADRHCVPGLSMYCRKPIRIPEFLAMVHMLLARVRRGATAGARHRDGKRLRLELSLDLGDRVRRGNRAPTLGRGASRPHEPRRARARRVPL